MRKCNTYIRAYALVGFTDLIEGLGGDPAALLLEAGIPPAALHDPDMPISYKKCALLMDNAANVLDHPALGLAWTISMHPHFLIAGPLTLIPFVVRNFGEWIDMAQRSLAYHTNGFSFNQIEPEAPDELRYRYVSDPFVLSSRQQTEHVLALVCMVARKAVNRPDEHPRLVRFSHSRPADLTLHEQAFGCPIEFDCDHDELVFPASHLEIPTSGSLALLQPLVRRILRYRIEKQARYDPVASTTVALVIPSVIGTGNCNIDLVAMSLGQSTKTLQRKLAAEDTSFSEIFDMVRHKMAIRLLTESNAPIERIAGLLDYSSNAAFTLAFKRWTGTTPLRYRNEIRRPVKVPELAAPVGRPPSPAFQDRG